MSSIALIFRSFEGLEVTIYPDDLGDDVRRQVDAGRAGERPLHTGGVTGSIPVAPTIISAEKLSFSIPVSAPNGIWWKEMEAVHA